jgi:DNA polymerase-3 subunit epsilon
LINFATIDFETTGLSSKLDRVIEVGVVRTDIDGKILAEYTTLINPMRDIGPTYIHGVSAGQVADAPLFSEIIFDLAEILNGAVMVAHNAAFDTRFLVAELSRAVCAHTEFDPLCTLYLMKSTQIGGPRKLIDCCNSFNIKVENSHQALSDAKMTSLLLHRLIGEEKVNFDFDPIWIEPGTKTSKSPVTRDAITPREVESHYLSKMISRLGSRDDSGLVSAASVAQYLNLLDMFLEDRRITKEESDELISFAEDLHLSEERVRTLNATYLANICVAATSDGVVTDVERSDIKNLAVVLGVADWESLLEVTTKPVNLSKVENRLVAGISVCFTGDMHKSREEMSLLATSLGLVVLGNVSKKLDLLVVADPDTASGKARKARQYGIRIIAESVFLRMAEQASAS